MGVCLLLGFGFIFSVMSLCQITDLQDWYSQCNNLYVAFFVLKYITLCMVGHVETYDFLGMLDE